MVCRREQGTRVFSSAVKSGKGPGDCSKQPTQLLLKFAASKISFHLEFESCDCHLNRVSKVEYQVQNIPLNVFFFFFHLCFGVTCPLCLCFYINHLIYTLRQMCISPRIVIHKVIQFIFLECIKACEKFLSHR